LLVGINEYPEASNRLRGCVNDCRYLKRILVDRYRFSEQDIVTVVDEDEEGQEDPPEPPKPSRPPKPAKPPKPAEPAQPPRRPPCSTIRVTVCSTGARIS